MSGGKLCRRRESLPHSHRWHLAVQQSGTGLRQGRPPTNRPTTATSPKRERQGGLVRRLALDAVVMARRMPTVNCVKEQADAELYFEMEFPGKDPDTISFSSKSIESFSSETTNPDSR